MKYVSFETNKIDGSLPTSTIASRGGVLTYNLLLTETSYIGYLETDCSLEGLELWKVQSLSKDEAFALVMQTHPEAYFDVNNKFTADGNHWWLLP